MTSTPSAEPSTNTVTDNPAALSILPTNNRGHDVWYEPGPLVGSALIGADKWVLGAPAPHRKTQMTRAFAQVIVTGVGGGITTLNPQRNRSEWLDLAAA